MFCISIELFGLRRLSYTYMVKLESLTINKRKNVRVKMNDEKKVGSVADQSELTRLVELIAQIIE